MVFEVLHHALSLSRWSPAYSRQSWKTLDTYALNVTEYKWMVDGFKLEETLAWNSPLVMLAVMCMYLQRQKKDRDGQHSKQDVAMEALKREDWN